MLMKIQIDFTVTQGQIDQLPRGRMDHLTQGRIDELTQGRIPSER